MHQSPPGTSARDGSLSKVVERPSPATANHGPSSGREVAGDSDSSQTTCLEAGDEGCSSGQIRCDPALGVPLPVGSSKKEKTDAQYSHLKAAQDNIDKLTPSMGTLPRLADLASHVAALGPSGVRRLRRKRMMALRKLARTLRGLSDSLISQADAHVASVLRAAGPGGVHVALIKQLLDEIGYPDAESLVANLLSGFDLIGDVVVNPEAEQCPVRDFECTPEHVDNRAEELAAKFVAMQSALKVGSLEEDARAEIFRQTVEDQKAPARIGPFRAPKVGGRRVAPPTRRFGVEQLTATGKRKIRCIDDFAASLVNGLARVTRRIRMGRISDILACASIISGPDGESVHLLKSDFKAAYRCCPITSGHLPYANILVQDPSSGVVLEATQYAMPFGAVAAVYAWDRLGEAIVRIIEHILIVAVGRYVDDLFMADFAETSEELRSLLLELVGLLGLTLEETKTPAPGESLEILGVVVALSRLRGVDGMTLRASLTVGQSKRARWAELIEHTLATGVITYRELEKLVGRLAFASSAAWGPLARGHLTSLYGLLAKGGSCLDVGAMVCAAGDLEWWKQWLLEARLVSVVPRVVALPWAIVYSDAEGDGGVGAVLGIDGEFLWLAGHIPKHVSVKLKKRKTQIFPFEVIAATISLMKWGPVLRGRRVAFFVDNVGARGSLASGRSSQPDVNSIVRVVWQLVIKYRLAIFFVWVPSALNVADGPSRGESIAWARRVPLDVRWESVSDCSFF